jgi:spore germination cell wall hydrolase CwlJ-like protein
MFRPLKAAAYAAATLVALSSATYSGAVFAGETEVTPVVHPYTEHALAGTALTASIPIEKIDAASLAVPGTDLNAPVMHKTPDEDSAEDDTPRSLPELVSYYSSADIEDAEQRCLATAVYFESKGEPLKGQLAVAEVIMNRARSGRFPSSLCGVVKQPGQFSFVHSGALPSVQRASGAWHTAVAIARIASEHLTPATAPKAMFFHAARVSPGWRLTRVAAVGNHVFYR